MMRARRNVARLSSIGLLAVALLLLGGAGSAGADGPGSTLVAHGWWWQANDSHLPTPLPPPPNVQPGQLNIQRAPTDDRGAAFAALRYSIDADHTVQTLTLPVAADGDSGAPAVLLACVTGSAWQQVDGGSWSTAPNVDLNRCVNGTKAADGKTWAFGVGPLQLATVLDIAIVPGVDPQTSQRTPFSITFDAPPSDALTTIAQTPPPVVTSPTLPSSTPEGATQGAAGGSSFAAPSVPTVASALPSSKIGETATSPTKQAATQTGLENALAAATPAKDRDKRIGYVVLALAAAIGLYAWRQDSLLAANGGTLPGASDEPAGLGRFAKPRQGQPPALT